MMIPSRRQYVRPPPITCIHNRVDAGLSSRRHQRVATNASKRNILVDVLLLPVLCFVSWHGHFYPHVVVGVYGYVSSLPSVRNMQHDLLGVATTTTTATTLRRQQHLRSSSNSENEIDEQEFRVVIIGSGWAGLSAADVLCQSHRPSKRATTSTTTTTTTTTRIDLLDAAPQVGGLAAGWKSNTTQTKSSVEGGLHGFWREYRNTFATIQRICDSIVTTTTTIDSKGNNNVTTIDDLLTPYIPSILYSQSGRVALAPVIGTENDVDDDDDDNRIVPNYNDVVQRIILMSSTTRTDQNKALFLSLVAKFLPAPLDIAIGSDFSSESKLSLVDRISALNLLSIWANFDPAKASSWDRYDDVSADSLFRGSAQVSRTLYDELIAPLLSVLPMCPGYDCSAAAAISCFHAFALCRKGAFDVRWCRGTITETIFRPWIQLLQHQNSKFHVRNNAKVTAITEIAGDTTGTKNRFVVSINNNNNETIICDAIVFAVGIGGAQKLRLASTPLLSSLPGTKQWDQLRAISCLCVRLYLNASMPLVQELIHDKMNDSPVAVCGPNILLPELCETGFCIYDLRRLQDEFRTSYSTTGVAAIEVDFYRATNAVIDLPDNDISDLTLRVIAKALKLTTPTNNDCVVDVSVVRARNAVSHFSVGSASCTPPSVKLRHGLYICGDWIDRKGHASWSTEKAVVTGRQAATALANDFNIAVPKSATRIIPAAPDTPQLATLRKVDAFFRTFDPNAKPWLF